MDNIVNFHPFQNIKFFLNKINKNSIVGIDENKTAYIFKKICSDLKITTRYLGDPCVYPKAQKNITELSGARSANLRDGVSITKFLYWLKNEMVINNTDEIKAANYLYKLRKNNTLFYSLSFDTISAVGKHAALPHYRVTPDSNLPFTNNTIYLFDSGAQYHDGTTDITRTIILGKPTKEQQDRFTRVLKGHIAINETEFAINTIGYKLDSLARKSLNDIGCDYDHGTGHGIGSFLNVHEGPQRITKLKEINDGEIREGMILSNEPGFYKKEKYGIRIENLMIAQKKTENSLRFEIISWAPIDVDLIDISLLTFQEIDWLNNYHKKVFFNLNEKLNSKESLWLEKVTQSLTK